MTEIHKNPTVDIYRIMDKSGLTLARLQNPSMSQTKIVENVRLAMVENFKEYILQRDKELNEPEEI